MGANDPQDMTNLDSRDMVGKIYVGDHLDWHQSTKYI